MATKLTLSVDATVIKRAKAFAKKNNTSLSKLIENYLSYLTRKEKEYDNDGISPLVTSLSGVIKSAHNFDYKKERTKYLGEKYT